MITKKMKYTLLVVIFLLGYVSLSFELIILRQMINFIGSNTLITSVIITFILLFMSVGYYLGSVAKLSHLPARLRMRTLCMILIGWYILSCSYYLMEIYFLILYEKGFRSVLMNIFIFSSVFLAFPSVCLGFVTSVIGRFLHRADSNYTGRFMAVDTMGSVLGSIVTTLIVMPLIGVSASVILLTVLAAIAVLLLTPLRFAYGSIIWIVSLLTLSVYFNNDSFMDSKKHLVKDDAVSRIEIISVKEADETQSLLMRVNGSYSSKIAENESNMFEYIRFINNTFIYQLPQDKKRDILVLGAGGFTIGLQDTFHNYTFLDIDKDLKKISEEKFLPEPLSENKKFIAEDAFLFMLNTKEKYDLIIVDVYSAVRSIPINFVTTDFFRLVRKALKSEGIMIANIITSPTFNTPFSRQIDNTLRTVFPANLERFKLTSYNPYDKDELKNVEYVYYNQPEDDGIFTLNKNAAVFGQE